MVQTVFTLADIDPLRPDATPFQHPDLILNFKAIKYLLETRALRDIVNETTTARTFSSSDSGRYIRSTNAGATTFTIDTFANTGLAVNTQIDGAQKGAGALTIEAVAGVTLNGVDNGSVTLSGIHSAFTLVQAAEDVWDIVIGSDAGVV